MTEEQNETGRRIMRCQRRGCGQIQLEPLPGSYILPRPCQGIAEPWLLGTWLEAELRVFGITKARVKRVINCNCEANQAKLDELGMALTGAGGAR